MWLYFSHQACGYISTVTGMVRDTADQPGHITSLDTENGIRRLCDSSKPFTVTGLWERSFPLVDQLMPHSQHLYFLPLGESLPEKKFERMKERGREFENKSEILLTSFENLNQVLSGLLYEVISSVFTWISSAWVSITCTRNSLE